MEARLLTLSKRFAALAADIAELEESIRAARSSSASCSAAPAKNGFHAKANASAACDAPPTRAVDPTTLTALQPCEQDTPGVARLRRHCLDIGLHSAVFKWVPSDYYQHNLQWRRDILGAPTIQHLCKTIVLENTHCVHDDCHVRENSRFYMIVYRYVDKFVAEMVMRVIKDMNEGLGKKKFNFRLADPEVALALTGFPHGAVCAFGTAVSIPVVLSSELAGLTPQYFWMGGGHVDCKVRVSFQEFVDVVNPIVAPITVPLTPEELEQIAD